MQIGARKVVTLEYTLTDLAGVVIGGSGGGPPLVYMHGVGLLISGLELALEGKGKGDVFHVVIQPEQAYGHRDMNLIGEVPRSNFPPNLELKAGMTFEAGTPEGGKRVVEVIGVTPTSVKVDANHPLAGIVCTFDGKVLDVREPTAQELAQVQG